MHAGRKQTLHEDCYNTEGMDDEQREVSAEQQIGYSRAEHIRETRQLFGEEAAVAEEYAWEMKDPSY